MKFKTKNATQNTQNTKQMKPRRAPKTVDVDQMEQFGDYILHHDGTSGGYTYGDDWSGDDLRALCDIFGA